MSSHSCLTTTRESCTTQAAARMWLEVPPAGDQHVNKIQEVISGICQVSFFAVIRLTDMLSRIQGPQPSSRAGLLPRQHADPTHGTAPPAAVAPQRNTRRTRRPLTENPNT